MSKTAESIPTALFIAAGTPTPSKHGGGCRKLSRHAIRMLHRGHFARGARKRSRKMSAEIVVETWDIGKHRNAYRGERALVCAIIKDVLDEIQYERVVQGCNC